MNFHPDPQPKTRNPDTETRNPKLKTRNPKPKTRNPKPGTWKQVTTNGGVPACADPYLTVEKGGVNALTVRFPSKV